MVISTNKYYTATIKITTSALLLFLFYGYYLFSLAALNQISALSFILMVYFEIIFTFIVFLMSIQKYKRYYAWFIILSSALPSITISYTLNNNINIESLQLIILFLLLYTIFLYSTKYIVDLLSFSLSITIFGKNSSTCVGHDYDCVSIYTKDAGHFNYKDQFSFIQNIIENVLGYSNQTSKNILINGTKYEVFEYTKEISQNSYENIILISVQCFDNRYLNWLTDDDRDGAAPINPYLYSINSDALQKDLHDYFDFEDELTYNLMYDGFYIFNHFEEVDKLYCGINQEIYLAFANILSNQDIHISYDNSSRVIFDATQSDKIDDSSLVLNKYLVTNYKKDDIASHELFDLKYAIYSKYLDRKYKSQIDRSYDFISDKLKNQRIKIGLVLLSVILIFVTFALGVNYYTKDLVETITVLAGILAATYSAVALYDRFFPKSEPESAEHFGK